MVRYFTQKQFFLLLQYIETVLTSTSPLPFIIMDGRTGKLLQRSARSGVPLLAPQSIMVIAVINLPASGGRKEFVYDQPFLHSYLIL